MGKTKEITLEDAKRLDERISKEYPDKKPLPLAKILSVVVKKKKVKK